MHVLVLPTNFEIFFIVRKIQRDNIINIKI